MNSETFYKIDFHVHTPQSYCYSDKSATYALIVEAAVASGLDAIAVTDHNTAGAVDEIRNLAREQGIVVIPGMELTTKSGHFLALFDITMQTALLNQLLRDMGVKDGQFGDGTEILPLETLDVFQKVHACGGLLIAAHIERWPSGFLESREPRSVKRAIFQSQYLEALEITVAQNRGQWESGAVRGYSKQYACIQGSDAHSPAEIGRRPTFLRLPEITLFHLKSVFQDWLGNIAFSPEEF